MAAYVEGVLNSWSSGLVTMAKSDLMLEGAAEQVLSLLQDQLERTREWASRQQEAHGADAEARKTLTRDQHRALLQAIAQVSVAHQCFLVLL